ncbi:uncharacterized protein LOC133335210 [Musca vetustissima]|uniref:uncharacterized protein LOC133335210 n=1 Tax=Musca vetustissima TaxID=27455 RepID=UPI002AB6667E|nr:uncharacterized protein LOC133335210 [Musca vetustissima]
MANLIKNENMDMVETFHMESEEMDDQRIEEPEVLEVARNTILHGAQQRFYMESEEKDEQPEDYTDVELERACKNYEEKQQQQISNMESEQIVDQPEEYPNTQLDRSYTNQQEEQQQQISHMESEEIVDQPEEYPNTHLDRSYTNQQEEQQQQIRHMESEEIVEQRVEYTDTQLDRCSRPSFTEKMHFSGFQSLKSFNFLEDCFKREDERLKTFNSWPLTNPKPKEMAMIGFYYTGEADRVICYFCGVDICCWKETDSPIAEHVRLSSNCVLLRRNSTNNIAINPKELNKILPEKNVDTCGAHHITITEQCHTNEITNSTAALILKSLTMDKVLITMDASNMYSIDLIAEIENLLQSGDGTIRTKNRITSEVLDDLVRPIAAVKVTESETESVTVGSRMSPITEDQVSKPVTAGSNRVHPLESVTAGSSSSYLSRQDPITVGDSDFLNRASISESVSAGSSHLNINCCRVCNRRHSIDERLKTFNSWPLTNPKPKEMAMIGFYYTGEADRVICYFCGVDICCWKETDSPIAEHVRWSNNCVLLRRNSTNNKAINPKELNKILPEKNVDTCVAHHITITEHLLMEPFRLLLMLPAAQHAGAALAGVACRCFFPTTEKVTTSHTS